MLDGNFNQTDQGTPQGGIISPTLANFTLNGLEGAITEGIQTKYRLNKRGIYVPTKVEGKVKPTHLSTQQTCVRYADDFIVIGRSKRMIEMAVKPAVISFLKERGLTLSPEKTKIISVRSSLHINFLGYTFQYIPQIKPKYKLYHDRLGKEGIACYPQRKKYEGIVDKLRKIIRSSYNITAYELIRELNPIIRG